MNVARQQQPLPKVPRFTQSSPSLRLEEGKMARGTKRSLAEQVTQDVDAMVDEFEPDADQRKRLRTALHHPLAFAVIGTRISYRTEAGLGAWLAQRRKAPSTMGDVVMELREDPDRYEMALGHWSHLVVNDHDAAALRRSQSTTTWLELLSMIAPQMRVVELHNCPPLFASPSGADRLPPFWDFIGVLANSARVEVLDIQWQSSPLSVFEVLYALRELAATLRLVRIHTPLMDLSANDVQAMAGRGKDAIAFEQPICLYVHLPSSRVATELQTMVLSDDDKKVDVALAYEATTVTIRRPHNNHCELARLGPRLSEGPVTGWTPEARAYEVTQRTSPYRVEMTLKPAGKALRGSWYMARPSRPQDDSALGKAMNELGATHLWDTREMVRILIHWGDDLDDNDRSWLRRQKPRPPSSSSSSRQDAGDSKALSSFSQSLPSHGTKKVYVMWYYSRLVAQEELLRVASVAEREYMQGLPRAFLRQMLQWVLDHGHAQPSTLLGLQAGGSVIARDMRGLVKVYQSMTFEVLRPQTYAEDLKTRHLDMATTIERFMRLPLEEGKRDPLPPLSEATWLVPREFDLFMETTTGLQWPSAPDGKNTVPNPYAAPKDARMANIYAFADHLQYEIQQRKLGARMEATELHLLEQLPEAKTGDPPLLLWASQKVVVEAAKALPVVQYMTGQSQQPRAKPKKRLLPYVAIYDRKRQELELFDFLGTDDGAETILGDELVDALVKDNIEVVQPLGGTTHKRLAPLLEIPLYDSLREAFLSIIVFARLLNPTRNTHDILAALLAYSPTALRGLLLLYRNFVRAQTLL
jgi:hypothetical protein